MACKKEEEEKPQLHRKILLRDNKSVQILLENGQNPLLEEEINISNTIEQAPRAAFQSPFGSSLKESALCLAIRCGYVETVKTILDHLNNTATYSSFFSPSSTTSFNAAPTSPTSTQTNIQKAFLFAVLCGEQGVCELLLQYGATLHQSDSFGVSPLQLAISVNQWAIVEYFLDQGAELTDKLRNYLHQKLKSYQNKSAVQDRLLLK
eukprot:TRINITY_DN8854_c0_g1_i1.p1 TRINITY_DN8854_c0_g1~~TRINITY_DN8854_c0_g1_i1.p1  ORF type:complete len:241 (-),score=65.44 TRINITY_DN8854_c0_g1_i1:223-843(-)